MAARTLEEQLTDYRTRIEALERRLTPTPNLSSFADASAVTTQLNQKAPLASPAFTGVPTAPTADPTGGNGNTNQIATTAFAQLLANLRAPKDSPVLTGDPQAPTPDVNDIDTSIATTKHIRNVIEAGFLMRAGAPDAADSSTRVATTQWVRDRGYAPIVNPAFTGTPTAPTSTDAYEKSTRLANTQHVRNAMAAYGLGAYSKDITGANLNDYQESGFFKGSNLGNAPAGSSSWFFVTVEGHDNTWTTQRAVGFTDYANRLFQRTKTNGSWSGWMELPTSHGVVGNSQNFNNFTAPGTWRGDNLSGPNFPGGYNYGILEVSVSGIDGNGSYGIVQRWTPDGAGYHYMRTNWGGSGNWSSWRQTFTDAANEGTVWPGFNNVSDNGSRLLRRNGIVSFNIAVYCNNGFGVNGVGTMAFLPDGWRPAGVNAEVVMRCSRGWTVWGSIRGDNGSFDWRGGGTGDQVAYGGDSLYGTVTYPQR